MICERCLAGDYEGFTLGETALYRLIELLAIEEEGAMGGEVKFGRFGILEASAASSGCGRSMARALNGGGRNVGRDVFVIMSLVVRG